MVRIVVLVLLSLCCFICLQVHVPRYLLYLYHRYTCTYIHEASHVACTESSCSCAAVLLSFGKTPLPSVRPLLAARPSHNSGTANIPKQTFSHFRPHLPHHHIHPPPHPTWRKNKVNPTLWIKKRVRSMNFACCWVN